MNHPYLPKTEPMDEDGPSVIVKEESFSVDEQYQVPTSTARAVEPVILTEEGLRGLIRTLRGLRDVDPVCYDPVRPLYKELLEVIQSFPTPEPAAKKILQMTVLDYNFKPTKVINMDRNADRQLVYKVQLDGIAAHEWIPADILKEKYSKLIKEFHDSRANLIDIRPTVLKEE